jgi:hypothetical protein
MAVSQRFIDLLNMPAPALRVLAGERGVELPVDAHKWDIARAVARESSREELEDSSDGYLYAGATSMSWFRFMPEADNVDEDPELYYPLDGTPVDVERVKVALAEHSEGDPFDERDRPTEVTQAPNSCWRASGATAC